MKDAWRFCMMESGELFVQVVSATSTPVYFAVNSVLGQST